MAYRAPRALAGVQVRRLLARLRLWLRLAPLLFAVACAAPVGPPERARAAVVSPVEPRFVDAPVDPAAIVVIVHGFQRICLGVAVSPVHVYTAAHCTRDGLTFVRGDVWLERGGVARPSDLVPLTLVSADAGLDRALLEAPSDAALDTWLDIAPARRDAWVWAVVYREAPARLERILDTSGEPGYFASAPIQHGDSGAPVIAENGALVGLVTNCRDYTDTEADCDAGGGVWRPFGVDYPSPTP